MNTLIKLTVLLSLTLGPLFASAGTVQPKDLKSITFVDKNKVKCKLFLMGKIKEGTAWQQDCEDGSSAGYLEKKRTNTSVFLEGLITDVEINLVSNKLMMKDENKVQLAYAITPSDSAPSGTSPATSPATSPPPPPKSSPETPPPPPSKSSPGVKADNLNYVSYKFQGVVTELKFVSGKKWSEKWKGETLTYLEESHDEWSVYLYNEESDAHLQIDLFRKLVIYEEDGQKIKSPIIKALSK